MLRLASLSMDSQRLDPPTLAAPDLRSGVQHYTMQSGSGSSRVVRDTYLDLTGQRARVTVSDGSGTLLYEDIISSAASTLATTLSTASTATR